MPVLPLLCGLLWLLWGAQSGVLGWLLCVLPGTLLLATGVSGLLWSGDARLLQFMALGALLGVGLAIPASFVADPVAGAALLAGSAIGFITAGYLSAGSDPLPEGVPAPPENFRYAFQGSKDEISAGIIMLTTWPLTYGKQAARVRHELDEALPLFEEKDWLEKPASYHRTPPPLHKPGLISQELSGQSFEHLSFESNYEPYPEEPGRDRWLSHEKNRTAHAWMVRHPGEPRPWLVCLHGIRMGSPGGGFSLFRLRRLHLKLRLNVLFPVLPIHGLRKVGLVSGDRVFSGDVMDAVHAGAQAMWDFRRLTAWLREEQGAPAIGVMGHSLGGYVAALLVSLDDNLDCAFVGNPAVDPSRMFWRNAPSITTTSLRAAGVSEADMSALMRVVSPLSMEPLLPRERLGILAGSGDRVIPASEAHALWRHWDEPRIVWHHGSHRDFLHTDEGKNLLSETLEAGSLIR